LRGKKVRQKIKNPVFVRQNGDTWGQQSVGNSGKKSAHDYHPQPWACLSPLSSTQPSLSSVIIHETQLLFNRKNEIFLFSSIAPILSEDPQSRPFRFLFQGPMECGHFGGFGYNGSCRRSTRQPAERKT